MSRFKRNIAPSASLFPFLSILACVIGVLALMIGMLAPTQAESVSQQQPQQPTSLDPDQAVTLGKVNQQLEFARLDFARLNQRRNEAEEVHSQLERSENELVDLRKRREEREKKLQAAAALRSRLQEDVKTLSTETPKIEKQLKELGEESAALQAQIAERKKPLPEATIIVNAYGRRRIEPVFVECRSEGLVIHEGVDPVKVPKAEIASNKAFLELLERMAAVEKGTVIFLVRQDAIPTYFAARTVAVQKGCRNGKLPVVGGGPIDLSRVKTQPVTAEPEPEE